MPCRVGKTGRFGISERFWTKPIETQGESAQESYQTRHETQTSCEATALLGTEGNINSNLISSICTFSRRRLTCRRPTAPAAPPPDALLLYSSVSSGDGPLHQDQSPKNIMRGRSGELIYDHRLKTVGYRSRINQIPLDPYQPVCHFAEPVGLVQAKAVIFKVTPDKQTRLLVDRGGLQRNTLERPLGTDRHRLSAAGQCMKVTVDAGITPSTYATLSWWFKQQFCKSSIQSGKWYSLYNPNPNINCGEVLSGSDLIQAEQLPASQEVGSLIV